mgnify:CR=1 FL=1
MEIKNIDLVLPEGVFKGEVLEFNEGDRPTLATIYKEWRGLCDHLNQIGGRSVNLPEGLSETSFCLEMGMYRMDSNISGANTSFDSYDSNRKKRIQVKACSVLPDLTSFGPRSIWDELYFCDFYKEGDWDGTFDIYLIDNDLIYNHRVNSTQTMREQQQQNRRPRFSIYKEIIVKHNMSPVKTGSLFL